MLPTSRKRKVEWLWPARIPHRKLTLFVGHTSLGKSFASLYVVTQLTTGNPWPDGSPNGNVIKSVIFSAEDSIADTIVPRLKALGAERGHIILTGRMRESNEAGEIAGARLISPATYRSLNGQTLTTETPTRNWSW